MNADTALAVRLATGAGAILCQLRASGELVGKMLGSAGDARANAWLMAELARARPDDAILSEETVDTPARIGRSRVWIVDPLDGTREYGESRSDWAVHVALAIDGVATIGAVALPDLDLVLDSDAPPTPPAPPERPRMVVSRSRAPAVALSAATAIGAEVVPMGSAGAKAMAVVRGVAEIYLHAGGQSEWDSCAPVAVARAAGLHCSRIDGTPLIYNRANVSLPDLLVCRPQYAGAVLRAVAAHG